MRILDFKCKWCEEEKAEKEKLEATLQNLGLYEEADYETVRDGIEKIKIQSKISKAIDFDPTIAPSYTKGDRGIKASAVIDQWYDHQTNQDDINKAIEKVGNTRFSQKESRARSVLQAFISRNYFNYLYARKIFGIPMEHPTLRPWYADYLNKIPNLINPGGEISLLEGRYTISATITIARSDVSMKGLGMSNTEIYVANNSDCDLITIGNNISPFSHISLDNFKINGNKANQASGRSIFIQPKMSYVTVNRIFSLNSKDRDIEGAVNSAVDNRKDHIFIKNSVFGDADNIGITAQYMDFSTLENCTFYNGVQGAIMYYGPKSTILNNRIYDCGHNSIYVANGATDMVISHNIVELAGDDGIQVNDGPERVIVASNICRNCGTGKSGTPNYAGIKIGETGGQTTDHVIVVNNICYDDAPATQHYGIWIPWASNANTLVKNNIVFGNTVAQILDAGTGSQIKDNPGYNPVGVIATPFDNATRLVEVSGVAAGPTVASQDYIVRAIPCRIISNGGTAVDITIKDVAGNTIAEPGISCDEWMEIGWKINFGAFTVAPTITVTFK